MNHALLHLGPAARLIFLQVLLFVGIDILYLGFSLAYAMRTEGLSAALLMLAGQYAFGVFGFHGVLVLMARVRLGALGGMRIGIAAILVALALASFVPAHLALLVLAAAGLGRGAAWGARTWLEMHHTRGAEREAYLALMQSLGTLTRLCTPLLAAAVLWLSGERFEALFAAVALAGGVLLAVLVGRNATLDTPRPETPRPMRVLREPQYWSTAPFYMLEGAGSALRQVLFVTGVLSVVGSVKVYAVLESVSAGLSALFLLWLASRPKAAPSLGRLTGSMTLVGASWVLLLAALVEPVLLAGFVASFALGNPLLASVKASLVLKGLASSGAPQDSAVAREVLLVLSRGVALLASALLAHALVDPVTGLVGVTLLALVLMPLEFVFARRIARA